MSIEEQKAAQAVDVMAVMDEAIHALNDRSTASERNDLIEARAIVADLIERDRAAGYTHEDVMRLVEFLPLARWVANCTGHGINAGQRAKGEQLVEYIIRMTSNKSKDGSR